ncbi:hypothetical protein [Streptomyces niveus]|uniref:hypothetical protein n=1 Tax=Streptomyces niveus TaxID=193462 RepID=UPI00386A9E14
MTDKEQSEPRPTAANASRAARNALLNAITAQVEKVQKSDSAPNFSVPHLRNLAEAYALVVHGNPQSFK